VLPEKALKAAKSRRRGEAKAGTVVVRPWFCYGFARVLSRAAQAQP